MVCSPQKGPDWEDKVGLQKVEELTDKQMFDLAELEEGEYIPESLWDTDVDTVYVLKKLDWKKKRYYLMHEMVHACLDLMDSLETGP